MSSMIFRHWRFSFSISFLALPTYIALDWLHLGLYAAWAILTLYIGLLGFALLFRFLGGKWKAMRVIEMPIEQAVPAQAQN